MDKAQAGWSGRARDPEVPSPICSSITDILSRPGPVAIIELVRSFIEEAFAQRTSDIHIEPTEVEVKVRLRIDGMLQDKCSFPKHILPEVISHVSKFFQDSAPTNTRRRKTDVFATSR